MKRLVLGAVASATLIAATTVLPVPVGAAPKGGDLEGTIKAGYGAADSTWHVGAGAGQYSDKSADSVQGLADQGEIDPHNHSTTQKNSYGVHSRLSYRTIVVEDAEGDQVAFVKSDSYLAMDYLSRRVGQILDLEDRPGDLPDGPSKIQYDEIFHMASHNHSSPYYMTPSWGVWLFQDAFDLRAFEYHARAMAESILAAEAALQPARMGATKIEHKLFKGVIARRTTADDGTPAGYPLDFGDFGLDVVRFDALDDGAPIATLINWGQHPEGLDGHDLITGDFVAPLERFVERATGAPLVFGQGDVGSAEAGPGHPDLIPEGIPRRWSHAGHAQGERGAFLLAQDVVKGWNEAATSSALVPMDSDFDVAAGNAWMPGPLSHPYPSVSNCRSEPTVEGNPGSPIIGLPDCARAQDSNDRTLMIWELLKAEGIPVPANYDAPAFTGVEENLRLHLQAFKLGEVILLSCACEAQVDLILNLESRTDDVVGTWDGYDWRERLDCVQPSPPDGDWTCSPQPGDNGRIAFGSDLTFSDASYDRMVAQVHNDAAGWDLPENAVAASAEPKTAEEIWGNFTHDELSPEEGYKLPIGVGHAGDYNGYTVSYREYMSYDHYRKALTSYGPHTADYMNTSLQELARELNDGDDDDTFDYRDYDDARHQADEARQEAGAAILGQTAGAAYDAWRSSIPNDVGPAEALTQPEDITRFDAATFSWRGGNNAVDNPTVVVQRKQGDNWETFADSSGEVQTKLQFPEGANGFFDTYAGNQAWVWTANFEAFNAFPEGIGSTPAGTYRFVVEGAIRQDGIDQPYEIPSGEFTVSSWDGLKVQDIRGEPDGSVSFTVDATYRQTYESVFDYVAVQMENEAGEDAINDPFCETCSFRPWATSGIVGEVTVTVTRADGSTEQVPAQRGEDGRWSAPTGLFVGDSAFVDRGGAVDNYGETNSDPSAAVPGTRERPTEEPEQEQTQLTLSVVGKGSKRALEATLTELDSGEPVIGREIEFFADDTSIGTATTTGVGSATFKLPPRYIGGHHNFRAVFAGDVTYFGSFGTAAT